MRVKLLDKSPVELARVPEIIKESGTINPEQQKVHDIAKGFAKQTSAKAESLKKDLKALDILRLTENHMVVFGPEKFVEEVLGYG